MPPAPKPKILQEINAHKLVGELCIQFANEMFEGWLSGNNKAWQNIKAAGNQEKARSAFVNCFAPTYIDNTRQILGQILTKKNIPQTEKDTIYEALVLDASIPDAKNRTKQAVDRAAHIIRTHPLFKGTTHVK